MLPQTLQRHARLRTSPRGRRARRGVYTLWTILFLPVLLLMLVIAVDISQLWLARVELENSLEAAALAAVKEWGDTSATDTAVARTVGFEYARANTINGHQVVIGTNRDPTKPPNQNALCSGNLIFGAVTQQPGTTCPRYIFNAGTQPSCLAGFVLVDASNNGNLKTGNNNEWGIAFQRDGSLDPTGLKIESVTIDLEPTSTPTPLHFDVTTGLGLADNMHPFKVTDGHGQRQPDIHGFPDPATQIQWSFDSLAERLTFTFHADPASGDQGFEPCDRFRFGVKVVDHHGQADGDDIGDYHVGVTVVFSRNGVLLPPVYDVFENTRTHGRCHYQGRDAYCQNSIIVNPDGIPDLPCPPVPGQGNNPNGQSYVRLQGAGTGAFGVRAQASTTVQSLLCKWCGVSFGPFQVSACATAKYDCATRVPRLIRVEQNDFYCP